MVMTDSHTEHRPTENRSLVGRSPRKHSHEVGTKLPPFNHREPLEPAHARKGRKRAGPKHHRRLKDNESVHRFGPQKSSREDRPSLHQQGPNPAPVKDFQ